MQHEDSIPKAWLGDIVPPSDPFYALAVRELGASIRPGDEVHTFSSSRESWTNLAGRGGYALVRDGKVLRHVVTMMS